MQLKLINKGASKGDDEEDSALLGLAGGCCFDFSKTLDVQPTCTSSTSASRMDRGLPILLIATPRPCHVSVASSEDRRNIVTRGRPLRVSLMASHPRLSSAMPASSASVRGL